MAGQSIPDLQVPVELDHLKDNVQIYKSNLGYTWVQINDKLADKPGLVVSMGVGGFDERTSDDHYPIGISNLLKHDIAGSQTLENMQKQSYWLVSIGAKETQFQLNSDLSEFPQLVKNLVSTMVNYHSNPESTPKRIESLNNE